MTNAVDTRLRMLFVSLLYFVFVIVIQLILNGIFANVLTGSPADAWRFFFVFCSTIICLPIIIILKHFIVDSPEITVRVEVTQQFSIFALPKGERSVQFQHAILMFLLIFVPIDLISYLIPGMLQYEAGSIYVLGTQEGLYLALPTFSIFFVLALTTQFFVATTEEIRFRGVVQYLNQNQVGATSAIVISALAFGLSHFSYFFSNLGQPIIFPIWWGLSGFFIGLVLSFYLKTRKRILPIIIAHWWNNIMSTVPLWMFITTGDALRTISTLSLVMYLPLLVAGAILAIIWHKKVRIAATLAKQEFLVYARQSRNEILLDLLFGIVLWGVVIIFGG